MDVSLEEDPSGTYGCGLREEARVLTTIKVSGDSIQSM